MNLKFLRKLPIPMEIKEEYPLSEKGKRLKEERDKEIKAVFEGTDSRMLLLCGPCSADREDAVLEYLHRLAGVYDKVRQKILIIPRVYGNKPRTTGMGYKGMLHQPNPAGVPDMLEGLISLRRLHIKVIEETGFTAADELLYPDNHRYWSDLLSYVAVGARSVDNQHHRLTAGGLNIPVGMKNTLRGDVESAVNAAVTANNPEMFIYRGWEVVSEGNPLAHVILRGGCDIEGRYFSNYHYDDLIKVRELCYAKAIKNPGVIVDVNHGNSGKDCFLQPAAALDVVKSRNSSGELKSFVKGLMVESYLEDGRQEPGGTVFGQSITDACIGWEKTEKLIYELAEKL